MIRRAAPRRGFTLVEILVVIGIIAILVSLVSVVAIRVQRTAKRTAATTEIAQIANGIASYKVKMNVGYIPAGGWGPNGGFRLCSSYVDNTGATLNWPEVIYLKQLFPQMNLADNGLRVGGAFVANGVATAPAGSVPGIELDPNQTLVFFLTGGPPTGFQGFSTNRVLPFETTATNRLGPFLDFAANKYATGPAAVTLMHASDRASTNADGAASLMDPWGSPYAYFAFNPGTNNYMATPFVFRGNSIAPYVRGGRALNQKGFQLISAGENGPDDQVTISVGPPPIYAAGFGPGGTLWTPQEGNYAEGMCGADDVSNFNEGPLIRQN